MMEQLPSSFKDEDGDEIRDGYYYNITLENPTRTYLVKAEIETETPINIVGFNRYNPELNTPGEIFIDDADLPRAAVGDVIEHIVRIRDSDPLGISQIMSTRGGRSKKRRNIRRKNKKNL
jgi:hypothetical protein